MNNAKNLYIVLAMSSIASTSANASGFLGDTGIAGRELGSFQLGIEVQNTLSAQRKLKSTVATVTGTTGYDFSGKINDSTSRFASETALLRGDIAITKGVAIFAKVGAIREANNSYLVSDPGFHGAIGMRIVPDQSSPVKVGLTFQGSMSKVSGERGEGEILYTPLSPSYSLRGSGSTKDEMDVNRFDAFLDFGIDTTYIKPYLGMLFSYVSGNYSTTITGSNGNGWSCTGGVCSSYSTPFVYSESRKLVNNSMVGGVIGFSVNQRESIGFNMEFHFIPKTDESFVGSIVMRF